jgi:hypothetical protein
MEEEKAEAKSQRAIRLSDADLKNFEEFFALRRQIVSSSEKARELEIGLFDLHKRQINADFGSIRDSFRRDSQIEMFASKKEFADRWKSDCDLLLDGEFLHFFSVSDLSDAEYDFTSAKWISNGNERITRSFGLKADGTIAEISAFDGGEIAYPSGLLELSGFVALNQFLELLRSVPSSLNGNQRASQTNLSSVIDEIYIPFYRHSDEFCRRFSDTKGRPLNSIPISSWIPLGQVQELIKKHLGKKNSWLYPLENWAYDRGDVQTEWMDFAGLSDALLKMPPIEADKVRNSIAECTTQSTFVSFESVNDVHFSECEAVRNCISDDAYWKPDTEAEYLVIDLSGSAKAYSFPFLPPGIVFTGLWDRLRVLCKISKRHSASYLENLICAREGKEIIEAIRHSVESGSLNPLKNAIVELPPRKQQIQEWVNLALERGRLRAIREHVAAPKTNTLTLSQKRQLTRLKLSLLERLLGEEMNQLREFDRVIKPLPYFFEYPILQWERANEKMAFTSAVSLFHLLNKISCLIGFEEVLAAGKGTGLKTLLGDELVQQLSGKPSLGSWSKALEILEKNSEGFRVWKNWFDVLATEREDRICLINIRNRIAHPDFMLDESELDGAKERFAGYFNRIIPRLRSAYSGSSTIITHGRKIIRTESGESKTLLDCEKLDAPVEPFPRMSLEMNNSAAANLTDECLISLRDGCTVELRRFFQLRSVKTSLREIFLYERDYSGKDAVWAGLTTAQSGKLETSAKLFD